MDTQLLDDILSCPTLPSLPAVASRVLELTSDPDVEMEQLAEEIRYDQGIAAKILRTVNSSFFGLRRRCSSIDHALIMLGLGPVKSLVLGFSLVSCLKPEEDDSFDYPGYWQRALTSAVASKYAAEAVGNKLIIDEAFLAALFQDIGMVAMHRTLGDDYLALIRRSEGEHRRLAKLELDAFELQHSSIGAMLCENWKMPHEIVIPVRYHDRPTACPQEYGQIARCVALGNMVQAVLAAETPTEALRRLYVKGGSWLGLSETQIDEIVTNSGEATKELGSLFSIDVGSVPDAQEVLARADRQLIELSRNQQIEGFAAKQFAELLADEDGHDPITGILMREGFSLAVRHAFDPARSGEYPLSVVQFMLCGYDEIGTHISESAQDEVIIGLSVLLRRHFEPMGGVVCRLAESIFAVVLPAVERSVATHQADACCVEFCQRSPGWLPAGTDDADFLKLSIGVATLDDSTRAMMQDPELLVKAAGQAVLAAQRSERSTVRAFVPKRKAA